MSGAFAVIAIALLPLVAGCDNNNGNPVAARDETPPFPPDGVYSITGDGAVYLFWNPNHESDLAGYAVFRNDQESGYYSHLADVPKNQTSYTDTDVVNGETWYYAVLAFDKAGNESDLSYENVFDTPRPAGYDLVLFDFQGQNSGQSGYDFSSLSNSPQSWDNATTDIYFGTLNGVLTLFTTGSVDIQDYGYIEDSGYTDPLDVIDWAPGSGWAPSGHAEAITGHGYVIRIVGKQGENYWAKVHVKDVSSASVTLDWAYQAVADNRELTPGGGAMP